MDFLKIKRFRKVQKPDPEKGLVDNNVTQPELKDDNDDGDIGVNGSSKPDLAASDVEDDEDDDFITNEVKSRLKELRRNSFMVLIPEEEEEELYPEDDEAEAGETSSSEWRDVEAEGREWWGGFDAVYEKYCERMLFFDRIIAQEVKNAGSINPSPKSASKKHASPLSCLSLKKIEEPDEETEQLQQPTNDPYHDLEVAYVAQICLTWEAFHCQYTQLSQLVLCQPDNPAYYNHSAQLLQQFQVLLQRFIENEPFQDGPRAEIYARARHVLPKLLQIPNIQGRDQKAKVEDESDYLVIAPDIIRIIDSVILTFQLFVKIDKKKHTLFGNQNPMATPLQQVKSLLEKKAMKLKELRKKRKGWKKKSWPPTPEDVPLLFALIDVNIISRVLRMEKISKEQLFWCEEKIKKLDLCDGMLQRDPSPILFPC
ncbi:hypothetical protein F3Y22_tig00116965pilonHSYRG00047 [Hibiscus syriacus]|uniref:Ribosomal protein L34Ae n=1 Tax=Hibiscus syriacus TaxID=106335 RepID=A0A6A2XX55_HIBSY|nr:uncharacterized protein LOC120191265 [Hibiscus syriacus]KAE8658884.1 hypothetical protein F3Y22_tig00116965pilonHSYRG00047 [Hibiscus syriacus]